MGVSEYYDTEEEWLNDQDPYGSFDCCPNCNCIFEVNHHDVFHEGKCNSCGFVLDEPCMYHGAIRGRCQIKVRDDD